MTGQILSMIPQLLKKISYDCIMIFDYVFAFVDETKNYTRRFKLFTYKFLYQ